MTQLKHLILAGTILVIGVTPAGFAGPRVQERVEVVEYEPLNAGTGAGPAGVIVAEAKVQPRGARYIQVEIADGTGSDVLARIIQDSEITTICTSTPQPVLIRPDFPVTVRMFAGRCFDGTPSVVSSGTVTATLTSKRPAKGPRAEVRSYSLTAPEVVGKDGNDAYVTAVTYTVGPKERRVAIAIDDVSGVPVYAKVEQGSNGFPSESGVPICGSSETPISVTPGIPITVFIYAGGCAEGTRGAPTFGEVHATFKKR